MGFPPSWDYRPGEGLHGILGHMCMGFPCRPRVCEVLTPPRPPVSFGVSWCVSRVRPPRQTLSQKFDEASSSGPPPFLGV